MTGTRIFVGHHEDAEMTTEAETGNLLFVMRTALGDVDAPEKVVTAMVGTLENQRRKHDEVELARVWQDNPRSTEAIQTWRAIIVMNGVRTRWWFRDSRQRWERSS